MNKLVKQAIELRDLVLNHKKNQDRLELNPDKSITVMHYKNKFLKVWNRLTEKQKEEVLFWYK